MTPVDPIAIGAELETLIAKMDALDESRDAASARELVRLLMSLYGAGLSRVLEIVRTESGGPQAVLDRLAADPLLSSLLVLHDLHPQPVERRVNQALEGLRPHLPVDTQVTVVAIDDGSVRLKVERRAARSADGGSIRSAIERAIQEAAPEIATVHVDGPDATLIQIIRPSQAPV